MHTILLGLGLLAIRKAQPVLPAECQPSGFSGIWGGVSAGTCKTDVSRQDLISGDDGYLPQIRSRLRWSLLF